VENVGRGIFKNTFVLSASEVLCKMLELLFTLYAARILGVSGFGLLSFALAFTGLFSFLTDMGLNPLSIREIAKSPKGARKYLSAIIGLKTILMPLIFLVMMACILLLGYPLQAVILVAIVGVSMVLESVRYIFDGVFQAFERMEYTAMARTINSAILFTVGALAYYLHLGVYWFGMAFVLARGLATLYSLIVCWKRFFTPAFSFNITRFRHLLSHSWPFGLTLFLTNVFHWTDQVMLSYFWGDPEVGFYSVAYRLVLALYFIPMAFNQSVYPVLSRTINTASFKRAGGIFLKYMVLISIPIAVGVTILSAGIIEFFFGSQYLPAAAALKTLVWSMVLIALYSPFHRILDSLGRQRLVLFSIILGVLLNVILNLMLIPEYGFPAAAYTTVVTTLLLLIIPLYFTARLGALPDFDFKIIPKTLVAVLLMAYSLKLLDSSHLAVKIISGATVYSISAIVFKAVSSDEFMRENPGGRGFKS